MLTLLKKIFTWWNQDTFGTRLKTILFGKFVGSDSLGNKYYEDKKGKFGRYLAQIEIGGIEINQTLLDRRLAVPYFGQSKNKLIAEHLDNYEHHVKKGSFRLTARV